MQILLLPTDNIDLHKKHSNVPLAWLCHCLSIHYYETFPSKRDNVKPQTFQFVDRYLLLWSKSAHCSGGQGAKSGRHTHCCSNIDSAMMEVQVFKNLSQRSKPHNLIIYISSLKRRGWGIFSSFSYVTSIIDPLQHANFILFCSPFLAIFNE